MTPDSYQQVDGYISGFVAPEVDAHSSPRERLQGNIARTNLADRIEGRAWYYEPS